jgi:hypothetical protein
MTARDMRIGLAAGAIALACLAMAKDAQWIWYPGDREIAF